MTATLRKGSAVVCTIASRYGNREYAGTLDENLPASGRVNVKTDDNRIVRPYASKVRAV